MKKTTAVIGGAAATLSLNAAADVPASVTTAITGAVNDVGVIGAAILVVVVAVAAWNWLRKPVH